VRPATETGKPSVPICLLRQSVLLVGAHGEVPCAGVVEVEQQARPPPRPLRSSDGRGARSRSCSQSPAERRSGHRPLARGLVPCSEGPRTPGRSPAESALRSSCHPVDWLSRCGSQRLEHRHRHRRPRRSPNTLRRPVNSNRGWMVRIRAVSIVVQDDAGSDRSSFGRPGLTGRQMGRLATLPRLLHSGSDGDPGCWRSSNGPASSPRHPATTATSAPTTSPSATPNEPCAACKAKPTPSADHPLRTDRPGRITRPGLTAYRGHWIFRVRRLTKVAAVGVDAAN
jgi:hypothetical protein